MNILEFKPYRNGESSLERDLKAFVASDGALDIKFNRFINLLISDCTSDPSSYISMCNLLQIMNDDPKVCHFFSNASMTKNFIKNLHSLCTFDIHSNFEYKFPNNNIPLILRELSKCKEPIPFFNVNFKDGKYSINKYVLKDTEVPLLCHIFKYAPRRIVSCFINDLKTRAHFKSSDDLLLIFLATNNALNSAMNEFKFITDDNYHIFVSEKLSGHKKTLLTLLGSFRDRYIVAHEDNIYLRDTLELSDAEYNKLIYQKLFMANKPLQDFDFNNDAS